MSGAGETQQGVAPAPAAPHLGDMDLLFPVLVANESALRHNIELMAQFCARRGIDLAPHGKTTMAPELVRWQLAAGAWAVTAATPSQVIAYREAGVPRILLANQFVDPPAITWMRRELARDPDFDFLCYVDSLAGVHLLADEHADVARPIRVFVELGYPGGRTGCRSIELAAEVGAAACATPGLEFVGVAGYEGLLGHDRSSATIERVRCYLDQLKRCVITLAGDGAFADVDQILVTAGGSAYFDLVVDALNTGWPPATDVRLVLRSGCYVAHDIGLYDEISPWGRDNSATRLRPALEVWGRVLSRPELGLALIGIGRRDISFDSGLPRPTAMVRRGRAIVEPVSDFAVIDLNDQHAYLTVPAHTALDVGDLVALGPSHPCTTFDKWERVLLVDDKYHVTGELRTSFQHAKGATPPPA